MYGKHFQSTYNGSMVGSGPVVFAVWGYVIANTRDSIVELNPIILGAILGCTPEEITAAIDKLCEPDEKSRGVEHNGSRLVKKTEFAYFVPTYEKYRNIRNENERREYMKNYMRDYRKSHQDAPVNVNVNSGKPPLAHSDTDTDIKPLCAKTAHGDFETFWKTYPKKKSKGAAIKAWNRIKPTPLLARTILKSIEIAKTSEDWTKNGGQFVPHPATWLNAMGWEDEHENTSEFEGAL